MISPQFSPIPANPAERRVGITHYDYLDLFLDASDFGGAMRMVQDSRLQGPDPDDGAFPKYGGILTGFAAWMASPDAPVWRMVDIRTIFPTEWQASAWHAARLFDNAERQPEVKGAPLVGQECWVFGGRMQLPIAGLTITIANYFYLFRVVRVVVKLYVAQGSDSQTTLIPEMVASIGQRIVRRME
jgi:hypothetical protein